jgi:hypothetical protein
MLKTTTGKSHNELIKLSRNRIKADTSLLDKASYSKFKKNTGCDNISSQTRSAVIKRINELIMDTVIEGNYNIRIPNLGIIALIKFKAANLNYHAKTKNGDLVAKVHVYFQLSGENNRTYITDFDFSPKRERSRYLKKIFPQIADTLKETY